VFLSLMLGHRPGARLTKTKPIRSVF